MAWNNLSNSLTENSRKMNKLKVLTKIINQHQVFTHARNTSVRLREFLIHRVGANSHIYKNEQIFPHKRTSCFHTYTPKKHILLYYLYIHPHTRAYIQTHIKIQRHRSTQA